MNYTVDYFINKFEAIPESLWCVRSLSNDRGQKCAVGHCLNDGESSNKESLDLYLVFNCSVIDINNGDDNRYQQLTPKQRVLAALYDIKAKEIQITEVHEVLNNVSEKA